MEKNHLFSVDFLKFVAALMITNSHFQLLYEPLTPSLATFGVHGNALFFFVSGFLLMRSFEKHGLTNIIDWYKVKFRRLWPPVIIWTLWSAVVWKMQFSVSELLLATKYWFVQSIAINFLLFYGILKVQAIVKSCSMENSLKIVFGVSIAVSVIYFFMMPNAVGSVYHTKFHYICHFSIMIMGAIVYRRKYRWKNITKRDAVLLFLSFILYFIFMGIGKNHNNVLYNIQILALLPLHTFVYYSFKIANSRKLNAILNYGFFSRFISVVAALTLEIYVVQFVVITDKFNGIFPVNIIINLILILIAAYWLKVLTSVFLQVLNLEPFNLSKIFRE